MAKPKVIEMWNFLCWFVLCGIGRISRQKKPQGKYQLNLFLLVRQEFIGKSLALSWPAASILKIVNRRTAELADRTERTPEVAFTFSRLKNSLLGKGPGSIQENQATAPL